MPEMKLLSVSSRGSSVNSIPTPGDGPIRSNTQGTTPRKGGFGRGRGKRPKAQPVGKLFTTASPPAPDTESPGTPAGEIKKAPETVPATVPAPTTAPRWGPMRMRPGTTAVSRQTSPGMAPQDVPAHDPYKPAGRAQPVPGCFPLGSGKQKMAPYVFDKETIEDAMEMVQKHIGRINQIQFYEELQREVTNIYNDLTIWTTKLFREMLAKIKGDPEMRELEAHGRRFLSEKIGTYKDLFKAELYLLDKEAGRIDEVDSIRFARAVASLMKDLTSLKEMRLDGRWI